MAEHQTRGWVWGKEDKLPGKLDDLDRKTKQVKTQMKRFADALPELAGEATDVESAFIDSAKPLVGLWKARKNKFLPLSPDEATDAFEKARRAEEAWHTFVGRRDVQDAIRGVNREVRAQERRFNSALTDARSEALGRLETPEFQAQFRAQVGTALDQALLAADMAIALGFGGIEHREVLRRLALVHFVRITYEESEERADRLAEFIRRTPSASMLDVAMDAALNILRHEVSVADPRRPTFGGPYDKISASIQAAMERLIAAVRKWVAEGKTPDQIGAGFFTILGYDFSLSARPN